MSFIDRFYDDAADDVPHTPLRQLVTRHDARAVRLAQEVEALRTTLRSLPCDAPERWRIAAEMEVKSILADAAWHTTGGDGVAARELLGTAADPFEDLEVEILLYRRERLLAKDRYFVMDRETDQRIILSDPGIDDYRNELLWSPERPTLLAFACADFLIATEPQIAPCRVH